MIIAATILTVTNVALAIAGVVVVFGYAFLILAPACECYSRIWEKAAAAFLTTFILVGLIVTGAAIGAALVWSYDRWA